MPVNKLARQGDILFVKVDGMPKGLKKAKDSIIAHGEVTGHAHKVSDESDVAVLENEQGDKFVDATEEGFTVVHDEHGPIEFSEGVWEARRQREYSPEAIRRVAD